MIFDAAAVPAWHRRDGAFGFASGKARACKRARSSSYGLRGQCLPIVPTPCKQHGRGDLRRFPLTKAGQKQLETEKRDWHAMAAIVSKVLE